MGSRRPVSRHALRRSTPAPPPRPKRDWAYFFDLDGTLIEFAPTPAAVRVNGGLRELLRELHGTTGGAVALLTGRPIAEVDRLFRRVRLPVAGQHGVERRDATGRVSRHRFPSTRLDRVRRQLVGRMNGKRGLLLEDKGLSIALHYRRAPRLAAFAHRLARSMLPALGRHFCVQRGKYVVELRPSGRDKGKGVLEFLRERPFRGRLPVFVGDDATDEAGFATVNRLGGISIKVGPGRTAACWRLRNVRTVEQWLRSISD
jgi:trehalose 6-phosphate phosphatase